jgi:hypothetical protein
MIDLHIGAPAIFENLAYRVMTFQHSWSPGEHDFISREDFNEHIWPYLSQKVKDAAALARLRDRAFDAIEQLRADSRAFVSHPQILGTQSDYFRGGKAFRSLEHRVKRLCTFLDGIELTLHININNQVDTIWGLVGVSNDEKRSGILRSGLSWSNVVWRLRRAAPMCHIVVWDFERPSLVAPLQMHSLFLLGGNLSYAQLDQMVMEETRANDVRILEYLNEDERLAVEKLDRQYDLDLEKIRAMNGVTLVSHSLDSNLASAL